MAEPYPTLDPSETAYLRNGAPAFDRRFTRAMSFHAPEGLAAVLDPSGAYHIDLAGEPRYAARFLEAFGFYGGLATVRDPAGYFHIDVHGRPAHDKRFDWAGNYQEGLCPVHDAAGFYHVDRRGDPAYAERYAYVGDLRYGIAVAHAEGRAVHIRRDGSRLHAASFRSASPFHKGIAVVEDDRGAFHVDKQGREVHAHRFLSAEPFYNGVALCRTRTGHLVRLRETGYYAHLPTAPGACISADRLVDAMRSGHRVGLFVRHAARDAITSGWGDEVPLNAEGRTQARRLGERVRGLPVRVLTSPVGRCVETARCFAEGAGAPQAPILSALLGAPGAFADPARKGEIDVRPRDFSAFAQRYLETGRAPGFFALERACERLVEWVRGELQDGLTLFASHDLFAAGLLSFLGLKRPTAEDWADFLEGVAFMLDPAGRLAWHRFLGLEALAPC